MLRVVGEFEHALGPVAPAFEGDAQRADQENDEAERGKELVRASDNGRYLRSRNATT